MHIHQILVRPTDNMAIILYEDTAGNRNTIVVDTTGDPNVSALVAQCEQRLPPDDQNPAKPAIEAEISALEDRISQLKSAIGVT